MENKSRSNNIVTNFDMNWSYMCLRLIGVSNTQTKSCIYQKERKLLVGKKQTSFFFLKHCHFISAEHLIIKKEATGSLIFFINFSV